MNRLTSLTWVALALGTAATAQNAPKPLSRAQYQQIVDNRFSSIDTNHDGKISDAEFAALQQRELAQAKAKIANDLQGAFKRLDTNHDGKLTLEEFMASAPALKATETPGQMIQKFDANHDGSVSAEEFRAPELAKFGRVDSNHDGIVTPAEVQAASGKK